MIERERSISAAAIVLPSLIKAHLPYLEGVHTGKPSALPADFDRVAIDHRRLANKRLRQGGRRKDQHQRRVNHDEAWSNYGPCRRHTSVHEPLQPRLAVAILKHIIDHADIVDEDGEAEPDEEAA